MNKGDVEKLAHILSSSDSLEEATEQILLLDDRLPDVFGLWNEGQEIDDEVLELLNERMTEKYGNRWMMLKAVGKEQVNPVRLECKREIWRCHGLDPEDEESDEKSEKE